jgi:hypothetical protein
MSPGPMSTPLGPFRIFSKMFSNECLSPVSLTPAINPCHGFSVIAGVVDTGDKFIAGDNNVGDSGVWGGLWTRLFMAVRMKLLAAVSDFGGQSNCRFGLKYCSFGGLRAFGARRTYWIGHRGEGPSLAGQLRTVCILS